MLILILSLMVLHAYACPPGKFGSRCQYNCHCTGDNCDAMSGQCTTGFRCKTGWFGSACQYVDVTQKAKIFTHGAGNSAMLKDGDDSSCLQNLNKVTLVWAVNQTFTWIRLVSKTPVSEHNQTFNLLLKPHKGSKKLESCVEERRSVFNNETVDIYCQTNVNVDEIVLKGRGINSLCSVYVSGGRNIAVEQTAWQTSDFDNKGASLAIDGNTDGNYNHGSCSHTDRDGEWHLSFTNLALVNKVILYNRVDMETERLIGFTLRAVCEPEDFHYVDGEVNPQMNYTVVIPVQHTSMSEIVVSAAENDTVHVYLTLCEVEVYGELLCPVGKYGLECKNSCHCHNDHHKCHSSTGGCLSIVCPNGKWGVDCSQNCSDNCLNSLCHSETGRCYNCTSKFFGDLCNQPCQCPGVAMAMCSRYKLQCRD